MQPMVTFECDTLTMRPWADDVIDSLGFDPRAPYVERFWLGVLGPEHHLAAPAHRRRVRPAPRGLRACRWARRPRPSASGDRGGRHSPFLRTVNRMIQFELAQV